MKAEVKMTEKVVAAKMIPHIEEARAILASGLADLKYIWVNINGWDENGFSMDCWQLESMEKTLKVLEYELCQIRK